MAKRATKPNSTSKGSTKTAIKTAGANTKSAGASGSTAKPAAKTAAPATDAATEAKAKAAAPKAETKTEEVPARKFCDVAAITTQKFTANQNALKAKKVAEKVKNAVAAIEQGKKLSKYTRSALTLLNKDGSVSGPSITKQFETDGLSPGTARAQAQQQTALFKVIGVAKPSSEDARTLVLDDKSLIKALLETAA